MVTPYLSDALATLLSLKLAEWLRQTLPYGVTFETAWDGPRPPIYFIAVGSWAVVFRTLSAYQPDRIDRLPAEIGTRLSAVVASALTFAGVLYLFYPGLSRLLIVCFFLANSLVVLLHRLAVRLTFKRLGLRRLARKRVLIVGAGEVGRQLASTSARTGVDGPALGGLSG